MEKNSKTPEKNSQNLGRLLGINPDEETLKKWEDEHGSMLRHIVTDGKETGHPLNIYFRLCDVEYIPDRGVKDPRTREVYPFLFELNREAITQILDHPVIQEYFDEKKNQLRRRPGRHKKGLNKEIQKSKKRKSK